MARPAAVISVALSAAFFVGSSAEQRGEPLRGVTGRDDRHWTIGERRDLACGEDDVRVVRQDEDLPGVNGSNRLEELARAGIRGLPAEDDPADTEVPEDCRQALPRGNRDDGEVGQLPGIERGARAVAFVRFGSGSHTGREGRGFRLADVAGLLVEVLDADHRQRA